MYNSDSVITADSSSSGVSSFIVGIIGGIIGAAIGGAIWAGVAIVFDYEIGFLAILVGALAGLGVNIGSGKVGGLPYQMIAVVLSVLGIMIGKFVTVYHFVQLNVVQEFGQEAWNEFGYSILSGDYFADFMDILPETLEPLDLLFFGLAIFTAFGIPKRQEAQPAFANDKIKNDEPDEFE